MKTNITVNQKFCTDCRLCNKVCTANAIKSGKTAIDNSKCILCGHCLAICPVNAIKINELPGEERQKPDNNFLSSLNDLLLLRRSVRNYKEKRVPRETIESIADVVIHSPTGTNSRKTAITIIDDRKKIKELTDILMDHFSILTKWLINPLTYPFLHIFAGKEKTQKVFLYKKEIKKYYEGKNILTHDAPLLMIFHGNPSASTPSQDGLIWATTAMINAEAHGLGTCFNGFLVLGINSSKKARKYLQLPKGNRVYETMTAGYPRYSFLRSLPERDRPVTVL